MNNYLVSVAKIITYISAVIYISKIYPEFNNLLHKLLDKIWIQIIFLIVIIQLSYYDWSLAILLGIILVISIHVIDVIRLEDVIEVDDRIGWENWNDIFSGKGNPSGANVDMFCRPYDIGELCTGYHPQGRQFNAQGLNYPQGFDKYFTFSAADFD